MSSEQDPAGRRLRSSRRAPLVIRGASSALEGTDAGPALLASYCEETQVVVVDDGSTGIRGPAAAPQMGYATWVMVELGGSGAGSAEAANTVICLPARRHAAATRGAEEAAAMTIGAGPGGETPVSGRG